MSDTLRIGLVGVGSLSQVAHLPVLLQEPRARLAGLCDVDVEKAEHLARRENISVVESHIEALIERGRCDAVIITTPTRFHFPLAKVALEMGAHVFLEMPPVMEKEEARELREISRQSDRILAMIRHRRFRADSRTLRTLIEGGELGMVQYLLLRYRFSRGWLHGSWRGQVSLSGGGILMDQGAQLLDLGLYIAGAEKIETVAAAIFPLEGCAEIEEAALVLLRLGNGVVLAMELGPWPGVDEPGGLTLEVYGSGGTAALPGLQIHKELYGSPVTVVPRIATAEWELYQQSYKDALRILITQVLEAPDELTTDADDLVFLMTMIEKIYASAGREG